MTRLQPTHTGNVMGYPTAGEERWQGQFTPIKLIWVKVGICKIQWSPTENDRPSTTHMASLTSQRGAQCRINGKPAWNLGVPHSGSWVLMSQMFIDPYAVELRGYPCDEKNLPWFSLGGNNTSERSEASLQLHVTILAPESAPAVLHQPIVLAPLAAIAHHQDAMVQGGSTNPRWFA